MNLRATFSYESDLIGLHCDYTFLMNSSLMPCTLLILALICASALLPIRSYLLCQLSSDLSLSIGTNSASLFGCKKYAKQFLSLCPCSGWDTVFDVTRCHVYFSLP